ncbi:MAG: alkaline phosphatase family protein [Anaerolineae bacterium]|nr:alkaline phosphatase family protein [Anaerolineae bacterium]
MAAEGRLPVLQKLMKEGVVSPLNSTMPHTSAPAWSSFMTGKNPAKTNIYDFLYRLQGTYIFFPNDSKRRGSKAIWDILSEKNKRVVVINVPVTYPVKPVNGSFISGFLTPYGAKDYYFPPKMMDELDAEIGKYHIYPKQTYSEEHDDVFFDACHDLLNMRTNASLTLMKKGEWDFFMTVFFDTDRILHQIWHYIEPENGEQDQKKIEMVYDYFQHLDESIGKLLEEAGEDTMVAVMSDHGMGSVRNMIVVNTWLLDRGFIRLKRNPFTWVKHIMYKLGFTIRNMHILADKLNLAKIVEYNIGYGADKILKKLFLSFDDVDWSRSKVYSFGRTTGPLFINLKGREPQGSVEPGEEYERVRKEIAEAVMDITDQKTGEKLVGEVIFREDVYQGPYFEQAPDLILMPKDDRDVFYGLADFGANVVSSPMYRYSGMHRIQGMLVMKSPEIKSALELNEADLIDVVPTVLYAMGLPVPPSMDGKPLVEVFKSPREVIFEKEDSSLLANASDSEYSEVEAEEIEERLRDLGYLG